MEQTRSFLRNSASYNVFKNNILKFIRPSPNKIFQCHNPKGIKLVTRLRLGLSHLREHKFKHSFQDTLNPYCSWGFAAETTSHYFLHCPLFYAERSALLNSIYEIDSTIFKKSDSVVTRVLLYDSESFKNEVKLLILNAANDFFCLQTDLMNHFIFCGFTGVFLFIHSYMATTLQFLKFSFSCLVITFFCIPGTHNSHGARWLLFLCLLCKCSFPQKNFFELLNDKCVGYHNYSFTLKLTKLTWLIKKKTVKKDECHTLDFCLSYINTLSLKAQSSV